MGRDRASFFGALLIAPLLAVPALADGLDGAMGKALFERIWVKAPSSTAAADGLGPLFNERSCASCHSGKSLSAKIAAGPDGVAARGLVVRLGDAAGHPDPVYGRQIQPKAVSGLASEGTVDFTLPAGAGEPFGIAFAPAFGPLAATTRLGARQAPPLRGIGLIDRVDEAAILAAADPDDRDGDGISGRARLIERDGRTGRYGWKASAATLDEPIADAFMLDMGLSSPLAPHPAGDCTEAEAACRAAPDGRSPEFDNEEVSRQMIGLVRAYLDGLAVAKPAPAPLPGAAVFADAGCAACHRPGMAAKGGGTVAIYSDLLLHDMGPALDDGVGEPGVAASEWRTAPLAGLSARAEPGRRYLHDGRAADLDAAIRSHGGEAKRARTRYQSLDADDRAALLTFLESL